MNLEKKPISSRTSLKIKFVSERLKQFCSSRFFRFYLLYFGYCCFFGIKMGTESFRVYEDVGLTLLNTHLLRNWLWIAWIKFRIRIRQMTVNSWICESFPSPLQLQFIFLQNRKENQVLNLPRNSFEMSSHKWIES